MQINADGITISISKLFVSKKLIIGTSKKLFKSVFLSLIILFKNTQSVFFLSFFSCKLRNLWESERGQTDKNGPESGLWSGPGPEMILTPRAGKARLAWQTFLYLALAPSSKAGFTLPRLPPAKPRVYIDNIMKGDWNVAQPEYLLLACI